MVSDQLSAAVEFEVEQLVTFGVGTDVTTESCSGCKGCSNGLE